MTTLVVGLGNPGTKYQNHRHNVGQWLTSQLAEHLHVSFKTQSKMQTVLAEYQQPGYQKILLAQPTTYMNTSGLPVRKLIDYFKCPIDSLIVVHDELDIPPGCVRFKVGGGHGGHNGLRDICKHLGDNNFRRIRIGVGHPGSKHLVHNHVLSSPSLADKKLITQTIDAVIGCQQLWLQDGEWDRATQQLHTDH